MNINVDQILAVLGAKEVELSILRSRIAEYEAKEKEKTEDKKAD